MCFVIVEYNGVDWINLMYNTDGEVEKFDSKEAAQKYADTECSFNYKIVRLY